MFALVHISPRNVCLVPAGWVGQTFVFRRPFLLSYTYIYIYLFFNRYMHVYVYIYMCVYVCVCVLIFIPVDCRSVACAVSHSLWRVVGLRCRSWGFAVAPRHCCCPAFFAGRCGFATRALGLRPATVRQCRCGWVAGRCRFPPAPRFMFECWGVARG